jgi:hypothetical protein
VLVEESMNDPSYRPGDIVQINPECATNPMFGGCLLVVTEPKVWGVMGFVQSLGANGQIGGQAFIRLPFAEVEPTGGRVVWAHRELDGEPLA